MPDPIASALRHWERRQEIAANNLANVDTAGFKAERPFTRIMAAATRARPVTGEAVATDAADGGPVLDTAIDLRPGSLRTTDAPLDLALDGPGFFVVQTPAGERWTRGGSFALDGAGRLVDPGGAALLGGDGPLTVPTGAAAVVVAADGRVTADGRAVGRLRVERASAGTMRLAHESGTRLVPPADRQAIADPRAVRQGMLEGSNVAALDALVELITIQRAYATVGQASTAREAIDDAGAKLGRPV